jgi:signal transduction histidine kinase
MKLNNTHLILVAMVALVLLYVFLLSKGQKPAVIDSKSKELYQEVIDRQKAEYEAEIKRLEEIYKAQDSIINSLKDSLNVYDRKISDAQLNGDRITIKRLPNNKSAIELSRLLSKADSVRGRFRDFRSDSVRWKNQVRNRVEP